MRLTSPRSSAWAPLAAGLAGGIAGSFAMNTFARVVTRGGRTKEAAGAAPGRDRIGRGPQPAQALSRSDTDAATRAGTEVFEQVTGRTPDEPVRRRLGLAAHYGFGAGAGIAYTLLARKLPAITAGRGTFYGAMVWVVADEGVVPAMGLSRRPRELPAGVHVYALISHLAFGATLDAVSRLLAGLPADSRLQRTSSR
jgi:hypothetical protein